MSTRNDPEGNEQTVKFRRWLNKPDYHSTAFIYADVTISDTGGVDGRLTIADCSRQIDLDIDTWPHSRTHQAWTPEKGAANEAEISNNIAKLRLLERSIREVRELMEEAKRTLVANNDE